MDEQEIFVGPHNGIEQWGRPYRGGGKWHKVIGYRAFETVYPNGNSYTGVQVLFDCGGSHWLTSCHILTGWESPNPDRTCPKCGA